jgi:AcrR family transcriptional regulator
MDANRDDRDGRADGRRRRADISEAVTTSRERLSADARREQLMAAAVETLADRGYDATTSDEIARRAGVSKGLLWHYFDDLDDLFAATARRTLGALSRAAGELIDLEAPAPAVIRSAIHTAAALRLSHGAERRAMREIVQNLRDADGEMMLGQADLGPLYEAQEAIFRRGQEHGDFRADMDRRVLAVTYMGAVESMLSYLDAYPDSDADRHAQVVADILLGGIIAPSGEQ